MSGGIIMAGVPSDSWRAPDGWPERRPGETRNEYKHRIVRLNAERDGLVAPPGAPTRAPLAPKAGAPPRAGGGPAGAAILGVWGLTQLFPGTANDEARKQPKIPPYRPPGEFGTRTQYDAYQALRRNSMPENHGKRRVEDMKEPPGPSKIAPPKVDCKPVLEYGPGPGLEQYTTYDEPRHRGQLGQDDPGSYLSHGARPGEPAEPTEHFRPSAPDPEPPKPDRGGPGCNPVRQPGPGREMPY